MGLSITISLHVEVAGRCRSYENVIADDESNEVGESQLNRKTKREGAHHREERRPWVRTMKNRTQPLCVENSASLPLLLADRISLRQVGLFWYQIDSMLCLDDGQRLQQFLISIPLGKSS